jgi:hypothetical protein
MKNVLYGLLALAFVCIRCDNRLPVITEDPARRPSILHLLPIDDTEVIARIDTFRFYAALADSNLNIVSDTVNITVRATDGLLKRMPTPPEDSDGRILYHYVYPYEIDSGKSVALIATSPRPGTEDTINDTLPLTIVPSEKAVGYLKPATININPRTDTASVFMSGGGWKLLVYALVSDSLGNPVEHQVPVIFSLRYPSMDSSWVSIDNLSYTGAEQCVDRTCDQLQGTAITRLSYDSRAILDTVIIQARVESSRLIEARDTLILPVPTKNLNLSARNTGGGPVQYDQHRNTIASLEVSLRDAYGWPISGATILIDAKKNTVQPNCFAIDTVSGESNGSEPCECEADSADCPTLPDMYTGRTDSAGTFDLELLISWSSLLNSEGDVLAASEVNVMFSEKTTGYAYSEFFLTVIAPD